MKKKTSQEIVRHIMKHYIPQQHEKIFFKGKKTFHGVLFIHYEQWI